MAFVRRAYVPPSNKVYCIDGASFGTDDSLVDAVQQSIRRRIEQNALEIPRLPQVAVRIMRIADSDDPDFLEVGRAIETDPALAARVVSLANAAAYVGTGPVVSLGQAISRLGSRAISNIVFVESVRSKVFSSRAYRGVLEASWRRSLGAAVACEALSVASGLERESAFLIGLLHDTGTPAIVHAVAEYAHQNGGRDLPEATVEILVTEVHESIGAHVLRQWNMPAAVVDAAGCHHHYRGEDSSDAHKLIVAAHRVVEHLALTGEEHEASFTIERVFYDIGLNDLDRMGPILNAVAQAMASMLAGFQVNGRG